MEFKEMKEIFQANFADMAYSADAMFEVDLDKDKLWETYLESFPPGTNEIFRERREHDCSACRHFIKTMGDVVFIKNTDIMTLWDFVTHDPTWDTVLQEMDKFVRMHDVTDVYITKEKNIGVDKNYEYEPGSIFNVVSTWDHFFLSLPDKFVTKGMRSVGDVKGEKRAIHDVFKRSLDELTEESVVTVLELIAQNSLYKGEEWKAVLTEFLRYKRTYMNLQSDYERENFAWEQSIKAGPVLGKIRNHSIGTLLVDISADMDLDEAVKRYEKVVAPTNYKRPNAIFTKKMLEDAKAKIEELGYLDSLPRRFATLDDITVNNILFSNKDSAKRIGGMDVFEDMAKDAAISPKRFDRVEEIAADDFVKNVLPLASELEVLLENKHVSSMVSLIAPENPDSNTMFKWNNGFGWAYSGNITDSNLKENVKSAGGKVDGDLRFSIQWNDIDNDHCDLDAHCIEPSREEIMYSHARKPGRSMTGGQLDVDIISPVTNVPAVENITWPDRKRMKDGVYRFFVFNFSGSNKNGFRAEVEFDGQIYSFDYHQPTRDHQITQVAEVTLKDGVFSIKEMMPSAMSSREVWGLKTNQFIPVSVVMYSPNYWDEQDGIGHRHYFFMLKDCINSESPNGFYNEFLKNELLEHKRVFEALGGKMAVKFVEDQLSGLGFSATKRNELIIKVKGQSERILKIKF